MAEYKEHAPGTFCWVDLATTDAEGAKKFYSECMGWKTVDTPAAPGMLYTMLQLGEKEVAALYSMNEEQRSRGIHPHWLSYVSVADADQAAAKARQLGATVMQEPLGVSEAGRMAVIQDPTGAVFAVWQPRQHIGALLKGEPRTFCWNELMTNDEQKAGKFYADLFGWTSQTQQMADGSLYTTFKMDDMEAGGMMRIREEWGAVPPNWMVYFAVEDCEASAEKAKSMGAEIVVPATHIPNVGTFAVIEDPQGAASGIIQLVSHGHE